MHITLITIGQKMPSWVDEAVETYHTRLTTHWPLKLIEIPLLRRAKNTDPKPLMQKEGEQMLKHIPPQSVVVSLEIEGKRYTTEGFTAQLQQWQANHLTFLIGGPEGLAPACRARANARLSLSDFTLPHPLARVLLIEQLYRAFSLTQGHPYHK